MTTLVALTEYKVGRNFIRVGHVVKVRPSRPRHRDAFEGKVAAIRADDSGTVQEVDVHGDGSVNWATRTVRPERVERVAQVRGGQPRERKR